MFAKDFIWMVMENGRESGKKMLLMHNTDITEEGKLTFGICHNPVKIQGTQ